MPIANLVVSTPNDPAQQPGPLSDLHISESEHAAPVCCSAWFGPAASPGPPHCPARGDTPDDRADQPGERGPPQYHPDQPGPAERAAVPGRGGPDELGH